MVAVFYLNYLCRRQSQQKSILCSDAKSILKIFHRLTNECCKMCVYNECAPFKQFYTAENDHQY